MQDLRFLDYRKNLREFSKDTIVQFNLIRKSYKQLHILLAGTLRFAKEEGYTDFSAGAFFYDLILSDRMFARQERPAPELETFSDDEVSQLVHFLWEEQDLRGLGLILMFQTGMRVGELGRIRAKRFNTWLHRACRKIGIPERSTHKIRKTYASILLSGGVDEKLVTSQMGHTDITITRSIYYYNRDSEAKKRKVLSKAINF